jgi:hypothetical protein
MTTVRPSAELPDETIGAARAAREMATSDGARACGEKE